MYKQVEKSEVNMSKSVANTASQKSSRNKSTLQFADNRPEAVVQRRLQRLSKDSPQASQLSGLQKVANNNHHSSCSSQQQPIQMRKGKLKRKKKKEKMQEPISVSKPSHSQEEIQDEMIKLWQNNPTSDQDQLRADYAWNYKGIEGGWCDGWSHVLSVDGGDLAELWTEFDNLLDDGDQLTLTSRYNACKLARKASLYHIMNGTPPTVGSQQYIDYQAADFGLEQIPEDRETWRHDENSTLEMYVIKEDIKSLDIGQTLRLTSPIHDAAVKRIKGGYIVSETESHGVQKCEKLQEALLILDEWREECEQNYAPFFNQTMIV